MHEPALADATDTGREFLRAMAHDDGPSKMAEIRARLNVSDNYASQYRLRLIAAEPIEPIRHGYVDFTLPSMREYLREHSPLRWRRRRHSSSACLHTSRKWAALTFAWRTSAVVSQSPRSLLR